MYRITRRLDGTYLAEVMSQSGWERWPEPTFAAAVSGVISGARSINHEAIGPGRIAYFEAGPDGEPRYIGKCSDIIGGSARRPSRDPAPADPWAVEGTGPAGGADVPGAGKARERSWLGLALEKVGRWIDEPKGGKGS